MAYQKGTVNGHPCVVDSGATSTPVSDMTGDGGDIVAASAALLANLGLARIRIFNVQAYGALGDARKVTDAALTNASLTVTSATASFTSADVGKIVYGVESGTGLLRLPRGTIAAVNSSTSITVSVAATGTYTSIYLVLGTDDTTAIKNAVVAAQAANAPAMVYAPSGGYLFKECLISYASGTINGITFRGDGSGVTTFFMDPTFDLASTTTNSGAFIKYTGGSIKRFKLAGLTIDGAKYSFAGATSYYAVHMGVAHSWMEDVRIIDIRGFGAGLYVTNSHNSFDRVHVESMGSLGIGVAASSNYFNHCYTGNNGGNSIEVYQVSDAALDTPSVVWSASVCDESTNDAFLVQASDNVRICNGSTLYGGVGKYALKIDATSVVQVTNCTVEAYSASGNRGGAQIASGGVLYASQTKFAKSGSLYSIDNSGTMYDLGGNTLGTVNGNAAIGSPMAGLNITGAIVNLSGLATSDPHVVGRIYSNLGILTVSAG